jgi:uncharacterized protein
MTEEGKTALITGASMGMGAEYARLFAADGHDVVLVARSADKLETLATELRAEHGIGARVLPADLSEPGAPARIVDELDHAGVAIDFLVNNAGFGAVGHFFELDPKLQQDMIQVNVAALVALTRLILPGMLARKSGRILNIASTAGFQPGPDMAIYYASKAFVISFSEAIAYELRGSGVTVTAHCPGATDTPFAKTSGNIDSKLFRARVANAAAVTRDGYDAMLRGRVLAIEGTLNWLVAESSRFVPRAWVRPLAAWVNSRD